MSARLKNTVTGVTIEVDESKVERLGSEWRPEGEAPESPVDEAAPVEPKRAPGRPKKAPELSD